MSGSNSCTIPVKAEFCSSNTLIQDGEFYYPCGKKDDVQIYRKLLAVYDPVQSVTTIATSQEFYVKRRGRFVQPDAE